MSWTVNSYIHVAGNSITTVSFLNFLLLLEKLEYGEGWAGPRGSSKAAGPGSEVGLMVGWAEPTASTQRGLGLFSGHLGFSAPRCLTSRRGHRCPFSIWCQLAAWLGGSVFRMFEGFTGFWNVLWSSRGKSQNPHNIYVELWASHFQAPDCLEVGYVEREAAAAEWIGDFGGIMVDSCANPCAFFAQEI